MYSSHFELVHNHIAEGVRITTTRREDSLLMAEIKLEKGAILPEHSHLSNHSGYLLQGKIRISHDGVPSDMAQGDSWCIAKKTTHCTEALEDSVVIEVFGQEDEKY